MMQRIKELGVPNIVASEISSTSCLLFGLIQLTHARILTNTISLSVFGVNRNKAFTRVISFWLSQAEQLFPVSFPYCTVVHSIGFKIHLKGVV